MMTKSERYAAKQRRAHRDEEARRHADRLRELNREPSRAELVEKYVEEHQPTPRMVVDIRTGEIIETFDHGPRYYEIDESMMTVGQSEKRCVSLNDHSTKLGRLVTAARKAVREAKD